MFSHFTGHNPQSPLVIRLVAGSGFLLLLGLLFLQFTSNVPADASTETGKRRSEKINLALRRTADLLLRASGDSSSRIPAVEQVNTQTFRLAVGRSFKYDRLPALLHESLQRHKVSGTYDVAVLDCATKQVQLGYSVNDLLGSTPVVACTGRSTIDGCYTLQLTFDGSAPVERQTPFWPFLAVGGLFAGVLVIAWRQASQVRSTAIALSPEVPTVIPNQLRFGQSCLNLDSQTLTSGPEQHNLTYREAKLLRLLANHPNQVLERDQILKQVWEDEGVTVGRSLDVFISRLRKLLSSDTTVKIAAVHGVGYRLDVQLNV
ncbi:winged helix-turn-helix domain-containing protein [Fibrella forsythiae]|uniref:Winged helix-turn-helix transcriptional regulator n=1 Tax=Fibrella forsythiae TaxID=2817061 RepID=A0ABS3JEN1_9BACT|nr:winged helix-turn-helix domain-containing protein [Fibrella forsythiae]MBO0948455.1 winged helix-turn-helix transcriptional regulator [Fibrella forsythiae]